jgi:outer membrane lipoprotein-sorting protein
MPAFAQDAKEIIRESEKRFRGITSLEAEVTMTIVRPKWTREMSMKSWSKGSDYALILITGPERDKGTANLKRGREVWNWMPRIERSIKLPPSMMSQSWMGSDFTNDDLVREFSIVEDYTHKLGQDSVIEGKTCWKIILTPKEDAAVVWGKVVMFVSHEDYLQLRSEFYDEEGYLINIMQGSEIEARDGRQIVTKMEMIPVEEEGQKTVLKYGAMKFDQDIPDSFFSIQNMKKVR